MGYDPLDLWRRTVTLNADVHRDLMAVLEGAQLTPSEKRVAVRSLEGMRDDPIAADLDMKPGAARTRISRAREKLRQYATGDPPPKRRPGRPPKRSQK